MNILMYGWEFPPYISGGLGVACHAIVQELAKKHVKITFVLPQAIERDIENHVAVKCDLCPDRDDYACVAACPTGALFAGTKEEFEKRLKEKK